MSSKIYLLSGLILCVVSSSVSAEVKITPISLHSKNQHYFQWRGKPTILVTSGEHYGALLNQDFDYVKYFDELQSHGLNHTRVFAGTYRENNSAFGITENVLAPEPGRYLSPWARSSEPGYAAGGHKFDLKRWDPAWFTRVKDLLQQASDRGIVVELTLFCPMYNDQLWEICPMNAGNNVNGIGAVPREEAFTLKHKELLDIQVATTRKIVQELKEFDNLYYEVCNEPYFGGVTMEWQHRIVDEIVDAEKDFPQRHLISMNIANGRSKVENPHPSVSIFNFHYCVPPDTVAMNYGLNKVIGENETGFRGSADVLYRTEAWDFLLAGGALYNNLDYSFTVKHPAGTFRDYKSPGGGSIELRQQLGILKQFLDSFDFVRMQPNASFVHSVEPQLTTYTLAEADKVYASYFHVPLPTKPKNLQSILKEDIEALATIDLPAGNWKAEWLDTKTGKISKRDLLQHAGGKRELKSPKFSNDIALRLTRQD